MPRNVQKNTHTVSCGWTNVHYMMLMRNESYIRTQRISTSKPLHAPCSYKNCAATDSLLLGIFFGFMQKKWISEIYRCSLYCGSVTSIQNVSLCQRILSGSILEWVHNRWTDHWGTNVSSTSRLRCTSMRAYWVVWPHPRLPAFAAMMDTWPLPCGSGSMCLLFI